MLKLTLFYLLIASNAFAQSIIIKRFQLLKTPDGKQQNCKTQDDAYQAGTYTIHLNSNEILEDGLVKTDLQIVGKKCHRFIGSTPNQFFYFWQELDYFAPYHFYVPEGVVFVENSWPRLHIVDRNLNPLASITLSNSMPLHTAVEFMLKIEKGILAENMAQFEQGELVSSVFYVYVESAMKWSYSWPKPPYEFIEPGPAFSLIYFIQKNKEHR